MSKDRNNAAKLAAMPNPFKKSNTEPSAKAIMEAGENFQKAIIDGGARNPEVPIGIAIRVQALLEEGGWVVAADMASARVNRGNAIFTIASPELDPKPWVAHVRDLKRQLAEAEATAESTEAAS